MDKVSRFFPEKGSALNIISPFVYFLRQISGVRYQFTQTLSDSFTFTSPVKQGIQFSS